MENRFIPSGVDARSWLGFEQRIQERRYQALVDTASTALAVGDVSRARAALDEARELRPNGEALARLETQLMLMTPEAAGLASGRASWTRGAGAALLFVVGVSMVMAMDWVRTSPAGSPTVTPPRAVGQSPSPRATAPASTTAAVNLPAEPATAPIPTSLVNTPPAGVPAAEAVTESARPVPTRVPDGVPVATVGREAAPIAAAPATAREATPGLSVSEPARPTATSGLSAGTAPPTLSGNSSATTSPTAPSAPATNDQRPRLALPSTVPATRPEPALTPGADATPAVAPVSRTSSGALDRTRVTDVLNAYVDAYGRLDARAAHRVWPAVDERALARAFAGLSSQSLAFDDCTIDVRGERAEVACRGRASYVGKVGRRDPRTEPREWRFSLMRAGDGWQIQRAEALRP